MTPRMLGSVLLFVLLAASSVSAQTSIRATPGGDRLLFVDGNDLRLQPGGERLLFIDGNDIRDKPGGERLLFVDGTSIRKTPGGIRLLFLDGGDLRRKPGSPILLHVAHPDIRPTAAENRLYFIDGPQLTRQQIVAVLFHLKPDLFKLSAAEEAALQKEMQQAREESEREMSRDKAIGHFSIAVQTADWPNPHKGEARVVKKGELYCIKLKLEGGVEWEGVALRDGETLYAALGPVGMCSLGVYDVNDKELQGVLYPCDGAPEKGEESLKGGRKRTDPYKITAGKAPVTGKAYNGSVTIAQQKATLDNREPTFFLQATIDKQKRYGVGVQFGQKLITCQGSTKDLILVKFTVKTDGNLVGNFFASNGVVGYYHLLSIPESETPKVADGTKPASGDKASMPAVPAPPGTVALDLSKANAEYAVTMFAPTGAQASDGITGVEVKKGNTFQIEIGTSAKDIAALKKEIEKNPLNKLQKFHVDTEDCLLYESAVGGQTEFHFVANIKVGDKTFGVEDIKGPRYSKVDVELMLGCAKTLSEKK